MLGSSECVEESHGSRSTSSKLIFDVSAIPTCINQNVCHRATSQAAF